MKPISRVNGFRRAARSCTPAGALAAVLLLAGCSKDESSARTESAQAEQPAGKAATAPSAGAHGEGATAPGHGAAPAAGETTADGKRILGGIAVAVPEGWTEEPVTSKMRRAQWKVPGEAGGAELVVYYFGQGGAGSVEKNLERWYGQFEQPDGRPSSEVAQTTEKTVADMKVTRAEVSGRYVAAVRPGAAERHDVPAARLLAAIVEAPDGAYYFKMVGPDATVKAAAAGFDAMLDSLSKTR